MSRRQMRILTVAAVLFFCTAAAAYANNDALLIQSEWYGRYSQGAKLNALADPYDLIVDARAALYKLLQVVLGLGAMISLIVVVYQLMGGQPESAKKLMAYVIVLSLGFIFLSAVSRFGAVQGAAITTDHNSKGGFGYEYLVAKSVLSVLLSIVCMVTLVVTVIHVISGEQDGARKALRWVGISSAGVALLYAF